MPSIRPPIASSAPALASAHQPVRTGFVSLTEATPLIAAQAMGFFSRYQLKVELHCQAGWATIQRKIIYGDLKAGPTVEKAVLLQRDLLAAARCHRTPIRAYPAVCFARISFALP